MSDLQDRPAPPRRAPLHLWLVGLLSMFWNVWGAYLALSAQTGQLPYARAEQAAYFQSQPLWLVVVADAGLLAGIAAALCLLMQHRWAVGLYAVTPVALALANTYEVAVGTSPLLSGPAARFGTAFLFAILLAQAVYASALKRRGVLT